MTIDTIAEAFNGRRVVVTGGAGFIGSHLADMLEELGADVCVFDSLSEGSLQNIPFGRRFVFGDLRDPVALNDVIADAEYVFHHAAIASVPRCSDDPAASLDVNVQGTVNVLDAVRRNGTCRLVFASSAAVYGSTPTPVLHAEDAPRRPTSIYGSSKSLGEDLIHAYRANYDLDASIVRYANVYGPRQPRYILFDLYGKIAKAIDTVELLGSGRQLRNFVYVRDAVHATLTAALYGGVTMNVSTTEPSPIITAAQILARLMGKPYVHFVPTQSSWLGDVEYLLSDSTNMRALVGEHATSLETGIAHFLKWIESCHIVPSARVA